MTFCGSPWMPLRNHLCSRPFLHTRSANSNPPDVLRTSINWFNLFFSTASDWTLLQAAAQKFLAQIRKANTTTKCYKRTLAGTSRAHVDHRILDSEVRQSHAPSSITWTLL
ncbi:unnamed protein product [Durusdinium trenchii]|uniref:Uncharacterized protein n=1 Tax=Durusdinium trenchii TaxID=1381693 RepID=A0ABP0N4D4_9DINO